MLVSPRQPSRNHYTKSLHTSCFSYVKAQLDLVFVRSAICSVVHSLVRSVISSAPSSAPSSALSSALSSTLSSHLLRRLLRRPLCHPLCRPPHRRPTSIVWVSFHATIRACCHASAPDLSSAYLARILADRIVIHGPPLIFNSRNTHLNCFRQITTVFTFAPSSETSP